MRAHLAFPGDLATPTGGYVYDRRIIDASGGELVPVSLSGQFPSPDAAALRAAGDALAGLRGPVLIDGLAFGAMPEDMIEASPCRPVALCHHPLGLEAGLDAATARRLVEAERAALACAAHVIVTSAATKATLVADFAVPPDGITVAEPGVDRAPQGRPTTPPIILTVASITPRKGHDVLISALSRIGDRPWRAIWAGPEDRAPEWSASIIERIAMAGLSGRIERRGPVSAAALAGLYGEATLFCLPSRYEGYGMVFTEAMMRGLPVVACAAGAVPETVPRNAGRLVPVDDPVALADAIGDLLNEEGSRREAGAAARAHALKAPGWDDTWRIVRSVLAAQG